MDLRARLLQLVAPVGLGDEISPGVRLVGASTELGLRLRFSIGERDVHVDVSPADGERPHAARTDRLLFGYLVGSGSGPVEGAGALGLCQQVAALARANEGAVFDGIAADAAHARSADEGATRVRAVEVDRILEPAGFDGQRYHTLSPYVGCLVGCRFCYAQSKTAIVRRLERLPEVPWGSYVDVRVNAAAVLAKELAELRPRCIKLCPIVSDPYQAVEKRWRVTRACLETIRDARLPCATLILTRTTLVERDLDVLAALPAAWVGASIPTLDDDVRRHFEPRGAPVADRLAMLATMRASGIRTFAVVQPILPGPIDELARALARVVGSVSIDVLQGLEGAERDFADPRFEEARAPSWQAARARELADRLEQCGVGVWGGELPPELIRP